jgi:hypothetical protein
MIVPNKGLCNMLSQPSVTTTKITYINVYGLSSRGRLLFHLTVWNDSLRCAFLLKTTQSKSYKSKTIRTFMHVNALIGLVYIHFLP